MFLMNVVLPDPSNPHTTVVFMDSPYLHFDSLDASIYEQQQYKILQRLCHEHQHFTSPGT